MLAQQSMRRLTRELARLQRNGPDGIAVQVGEQDMLDIDGWIQGPAGTPYAGGFFRVHFDFQGTCFPASPPRCTMRTKIFHPNIHSNGEICVSTLKKDWNSTYGIEHILVVIKCLLISPNPDSALDPEAARLLQEDYDQYCATAAMWTRIHANLRPACMHGNGAEKEDGEVSEERSRTDGCSSSTTTTTTTTTKAHDHAAKKMELDQLCDHPSNEGGGHSCSALAAQPLTRSGSTNLNLHKKASFTLPTQAAGVSNGGRRLSSNSTLATSAKLNGNGGSAVHALLETGLGGAAAAAAAATSAAMTAIVTAEMKRISLSGPIGGGMDSSPFLGPIASAGLAAGGGMTWPTRRRQTTVVRRGIKRL
jgi:ubiquitin-conjugating enzyme E2 S